MKLCWEEVRDIFEEASLWENGHDMYWYRLMWGLMDYRGMNVYYSERDLKKVFSRAFAIINIYHEFINICFDDDDDITQALTASGSPLNIMRFLFDDRDVRDVFNALNEELGLTRTFYSIFITCVEFKEGHVCYADEKDDFDEPCGYDAEYNYEFDEDELEESMNMFKEYYGDCEDDEDEFPEDPSEDYYYSFESYLGVLAASSMSILKESSPEKIAGYMYLSSNMNK